MVSSSNSKPTAKGVVKPLDLTSIINNPELILDSSLAYLDENVDSSMSTNSISQNPKTSCSLDLNIGFNYETDNLISSSFHRCLSDSNLQPFTPDFSVKNLPSQNSPKSNHLFDLINKVDDVFQTPLLDPSELMPETPSSLDQRLPVNYFSHTSNQFSSNQSAPFETNDVDPSANHVSGFSYDDLWSDINDLPSLALDGTSELLQLVENWGSTSSENLVSRFSNNDSSDTDALWLRFYKSGRSPSPIDQIRESRLQIAGEANPCQTPISVKRSAAEGGGEEGQAKKNDSHICKICNMSFSNGNALGGHLSYHSKKQKMEAQRMTQMSDQPHD